MPLRLVLIEDHEALREGLELLLGREGCEVVGTAGTAEEGRRLVDELAPDVALVDIRLQALDQLAAVGRRPRGAEHLDAVSAQQQFKTLSEGLVIFDEYERKRHVGSNSAQSPAQGEYDARVVSPPL